MASRAQTAKHKTAELSVTFKCWFLTIQTDTCLRKKKQKKKLTNCCQCILSFHTIKYNHIDMTCDSSLLGIPFNKKKKKEKNPQKTIHGNTTTGFPSKCLSQNSFDPDKLWAPLLHSPTHLSSTTANNFHSPQQTEETHSIESEVTSHHPTTLAPPKKDTKTVKRKQSK